MVACGFRGKEPQINTDERRCILTTDYIKTTHRKGRKERKVKRQESLRPLLHSMKKHSLSEPRTRMTRIRRIFTDTVNPCVSVSSVQSVFYGDCPHVAPNTKISGFIGVPPLFLGNRTKEECGVVANKEPQMNADAFSQWIISKQLTAKDAKSAKQYSRNFYALVWKTDIL